MKGFRTGLETNTAVEEVLVKYLEDNASDILADKIKKGKKIIAQCVSYITSQAKGQAKNGCAVIADAEVYGWAIHFFEEDSIKADAPAPKAEIKAPIKKAEPKKPEPKKEQKPVDQQISLMDLFGGMA